MRVVRGHVIGLPPDPAEPPPEIRASIVCGIMLNFGFFFGGLIVWIGWVNAAAVTFAGAFLSAVHVARFVWWLRRSI